MTVDPNTHCGRVLAALADGRPHTTRQLYREVGPCILHSRIADLRRKGYDIACEHIAGKGTGAGAYRYTWLDAPPASSNGAEQLTITTDEIAPRRPEERYRLFRVMNGGPPEIVATVATPEEIGPALLLLGREGEFDDYCLGIMDTFGDPSRKGEWVILPYQKGM